MSRDMKKQVLTVFCALLFVNLCTVLSHDIEDDNKSGSESRNGQEYEKCLTKVACYDNGEKCEEKCKSYKPGLKKGPLKNYGCDSKSRYCRKGYSGFDRAECRARRPTCCCTYEDNGDDEKGGKENKQDDTGGGDHGNTITHNHEHTHQVVDGHHGGDVRAASHSVPLQETNAGEPVKIADGRSPTCILMGANC